ncbi:MAG TPA: BON domain-containing protein [Vicinamibacterales bacterium]|nr:BON domain-containing protein [Vicinamibacterales bacterium]
MRVTHTSVAVAFALALGAGACSNTNSREVPDPTDRAERALTDANIKDVNVDWDKEARVAHLKGTVDSTRERERAAEVASTAVGTSGKVLNELTVEEVNEKTADDLDGRIRTELHDMVNRDQVLRDRDIDFDVNNGVVTVKGEVRTTAEKAKVTEFLKGAAGVKDFANALEIKPKS